MRVKLIDDPEYFELQNSWFVNQFDRPLGLYSFDNYQQAKMHFNKLRGIDGFLLNAPQLEEMRAYLSSDGSRLLANAIAAHKSRQKKRANPNNFTKKLQADVDSMTLNKLNNYCRAKNKSQAAVLTKLINSLG